VDGIQFWRRLANHSYRHLIDSIESDGPLEAKGKGDRLL